MKLILLVSLFVVACSQVPKKEVVKTEAVKIAPDAVDVCLTYQKNVLDQAYSKNKDTSIEFTKDPRAARSSLQQFDLEKGLTKPRSQLVQNILHQCTPELVKKFDEDFKSIGRCALMFSELNYFQGLAQALKVYPWPTDLKLEGKKVTLDYVRNFSEGQYPLLNRLVALSVLDELSVNKIVNEDLHGEIKKLMQDSQVFVQGLRQRVDKDPTLTCDSIGVIRDELAYSDTVGSKITDLLRRL